MTLPGADLVEQARALAPLLAQHAAEAERLRQPHDAVIAALEASGIFELMVPHCHGGRELDLDTFLEVGLRPKPEVSLGGARIKRVVIREKRQAPPRERWLAVQQAESKLEGPAEGSSDTLRNGQPGCRHAGDSCKTLHHLPKGNCSRPGDDVRSPR